MAMNNNTYRILGNRVEGQECGVVSALILRASSFLRFNVNQMPRSPSYRHGDTVAESKFVDQSVFWRYISVT